MSQNKVIVDSNFLFALFNHLETRYTEARAFAAINTAQWIIPDVVLVEVVFLTNRFGGVPAIVRFLNFLESTPHELECLSAEDLLRIKQIVANYPEANFDFMDCCIMALAERLNITQICTFDRRDFSIFRPLHSEFLELLP